MGEQVEMAFAKHQHQHHQLQASPSPSQTPARDGDPSCSLSPSGCDGAKLRRAELCLRIVTAIAALAGLSFLVTDKQSRSFTVFQSVITQEARWSDMKALTFSVVSLGIAAGYSVFQAGRCLLSSSRESSHPSSALAWGFFLFDQVMAYLLLTSSSASAQAAYFSEQGSDGFEWTKVCYLYEHFCQQVGAGIISAYVAFMGLALTSIISAFNLFASSVFNE